VVASRGLDALVVHVMKTGTKRYKIYVTPLQYDKNTPRSRQIDELADGYVRELERIIRQYPTQWYNYFDFWNQK
jgi:predicted LPLAT superfamily acyltransferase